MYRHRTKAVVAAALATGVIMLAAPAGAVPARAAHAAEVTSSAGALSDLSPSTVDPTDGASAAALVVSKVGLGSVVLLRVSGLARSAAGSEFGAHVHVGQCVAGNGAAAGPHYNSTGGAVIDATTEVWLDFTVSPAGGGFAIAVVPFVIPAGGARSIVIHAMATMPNGTAGGRLACLPVEL